MALNPDMDDNLLGIFFTILTPAPHSTPSNKIKITRWDIGMKVFPNNFDQLFWWGIFYFTKEMSQAHHTQYLVAESQPEYSQHVWCSFPCMLLTQSSWVAVSTHCYVHSEKNAWLCWDPKKRKREEMKKLDQGNVWLLMEPIPGGALRWKDLQVQPLSPPPTLFLSHPHHSPYLGSLGR